MVSFLTHSYGIHFIDDAEDIAQDTLVSAFHNWSYNGIPDNPEGWIRRVANNKALNILKKEQVRTRYAHGAKGHSSKSHSDDHNFLEEVQDSMLRMILACCDPSISSKSQIILVLSVLCGFSRKEIANALLDEEEAIKKRLFRAKKLLRENDFSPESLTGNELSPRLNVTYSCMYLLFNEGYNSSHHDDLIRKDLCLEAMRLTKLLVERYPNDTSANALLALMCFHVARFDERIDNSGAIVLFKDQNRSNWNEELIRKGDYYLANSAVGNDLNAYHIEASIAAIHCHASSYEKTNWLFIKKLYERLYKIKPSPIIQLNLAIVESQLSGIDSGIEQLNKLAIKESKLQKYHLLYATLGEFYSQKNERDKAISNFETALSLTSSSKEELLLKNKIASLQRS